MPRCPEASREAFSYGTRMRLDPFPRLTALRAASPARAFDEYRADIIHHLHTAERAAKRCRSRSEDCQVLIEGERCSRSRPSVHAALRREEPRL
jgi:hypothetical protein